MEDETPKRVIEFEWEITLGQRVNYDYPEPFTVRGNDLTIGEDGHRHLVVSWADNGVERRPIGIWETGSGFSVKTKSAKLVEGEPLPIEEHVNALLH